MIYLFFLQHIQIALLYPELSFARKFVEDLGHPYLLTILSVPTKDYNASVVWAGIRLSHSCLRGTSETSALTFYGTGIGARSDTGICLTVDDVVNGEVHRGGSIYVNRFVQILNCIV